MTIENLIIYTQKPAASTPKELKNALDCRRLSHTRATGVRRIPEASLVVNWGGSRSPDWARQRVTYLNHPEQVRRKTTKVGQIRRFAEAGIPTLDVTSDFGTASEWVSGGSRVLTRLDGQFGGRGINVVEAGDTAALLALRDSVEGVDFYSKYFPKTHEYRVHVFNPLRMPVGRSDSTLVPTSREVTEERGTLEQGGVIDIAQKKRRIRADGEEAVEGADRTVYQRIVRSHANGWVFAHNDLHLPDGTRTAIVDAAIRAVSALGLDFGAVDILVRHRRRDPSSLHSLAVAEVNTAPGIENTATLNAYVEAIRGYYNAMLH